MSEQQFEINKIYTKDVSSESPNSPAIHNEKWEPEINLNLGNSATVLDESLGLFEVTLKITVTATVAEKTAYIIEVQQAGIFTLKGFDDEQRGYVIGALAPNVLFPYARETISSLSEKAGFPAMTLNPIDFNTLYQQHLNEMKKSEEAPETASKTTTEATDTAEASEADTKH